MNPKNTNQLEQAYNEALTQYSGMLRVTETPSSISTVIEVKTTVDDRLLKVFDEVSCLRLDMQALQGDGPLRIVGISSNRLTVFGRQSVGLAIAAANGGIPLNYATHPSLDKLLFYSDAGFFARLASDLAGRGLIGSKIQSITDFGMFMNRLTPEERTIVGTIIDVEEN